MTPALSALVRDLYALRQAGGLTDAEAQWVLGIVLPVYGLTLDDLARWARGGSSG